MYELYITYSVSWCLKVKSQILTKTHCTNNVNAEEIQERYGERLRSRMRELFNLVGLNASIEDKRT
jgi:hypothetical protein